IKLDLAKVACISTSDQNVDLFFFHEGLLAGIQARGICWSINRFRAAFQFSITRVLPAFSSLLTLLYCLTDALKSLTAALKASTSSLVRFAAGFVSNAFFIFSSSSALR